MPHEPSLEEPSSESFSGDERNVLSHYFSNTDDSVFALTNLGEAVKGALFARYSRSDRSLRRLFLSEFVSSQGALPQEPSGAGGERARTFYSRVFADYGDDSVAQLGAAHVACEGVSLLLTKELERSRLLSYLEQSTRYVPYTERRGGRWKYHIPVELDGSPLRDRYVSTLDGAFAIYARLIEPLQAYFRRRYPKEPSDSESVYRSAIRSKALDTLRGLLPAATKTNLGVFGSGQAFESLLLQMRTSPLAETRECAQKLLRELRTIIPEFLVRVDQPHRGDRWVEYLSNTRNAVQAQAQERLRDIQLQERPEVSLTDFDPEGETKVVAAALYSASMLPDDQLMTFARGLSGDERVALLRDYVGQRGNRRHRPGRAFERTSYRFDVLTDYGAFRDLQRHRLLTIEWQRLSTRYGYNEPFAIEEAGELSAWREVMDRSAELYESLAARGLLDVAQYAVVMAYRIRFYMHMNAREAMHIIELRTAPQGHPAYRRVCQLMHRAIGEVAGHRAIADAMLFANHSDVELERLQAERNLEAKRQELSR